MPSEPSRLQRMSRRCLPITPADQDFSALIARLNQKSPSAVFVNLGPPQIPTFVAKLRESGSKAKIYANFFVSSPDVLAALGNQAEGIVFAEMDYDKAGFKSALERISGSPETSSVGYACYVALTLALEVERLAAVKKIPGSEALKLLADLPVLDGSIPISDRQAKFTVIPKMVSGGKVVPAI